MKLAIIVAVITLTATTVAVGGPPVFVPSDPDSGPVGVPVDGGASLLLAAGGSYAIKKFKERRKAKKQ